jgi:hypothetical protein
MNLFARISGNFTTSSSGEQHKLVAERVASLRPARRDPSMRFIVKSAFWLGIVLSVMPLGQLSLSDPAPGVGAFVCSPAWAERFASKEVSYELGAAGCVALAAARVDGASSPGDRATSEWKTAPSRRSSAQSLTDADRQPPWIGSAPPSPTRGWRATHLLGYKHVANTHPERHTADD